jgi:TonB-dependent Receptor Plug Domain
VLHRSMARPTVLLALLVAAVPLWAQSPDGSPVQGWVRQFADLEARVRTERTDDQSGLEQTATTLHALDMQVSAWLADRGLTTEPPPPESARPQDLTVEFSRVRALLAQARAGSADDPQGAGVFYLGRVDVAVSAQTASPGVSTVDASDLRSLDAKTVNQAAEAAPGVSLHRVGPRSEGMLDSRGFDLRQIPLLIDGIPVSRGLDAELSGSNLFDRNYQLYPGFPEAGRIVAVNLRYHY